MYFLVLKGQEEVKLEGVLYLERICSDTLSAAVSDIDLLLRDGINVFTNFSLGNKVAICNFTSFIF